MTLELKRVKVEGYSLLSDLAMGERVTVVGIVKLCSPLRRSKGPDWTRSIQITDPSVNGKITVIIFRAQHTDLPEADIGSIFLGTGLRVNYFMNSPQLIAYKLESTCTILNDDDFRENKMCNKDTKIMAYAKQLRNWWRNIENFYIEAPKSRQLTTIADIRGPNVFFDTIAEVVEIQRIEHTTELFITDYTRNELLSNNNYVWNLPNELGACNIFQVSLWDEHMTDSQDFKVGMYLYLQNIRTKYNSFNHFQGVIHGDPETRRTRVIQVDVELPDVEELIKRKELFKKKFFSVGPRITSIIDCRVKPTPISDILKSNEAPYKFFTRGRIFDYYPRDIEFFVQPYCVDCDDIIHSETENIKEIKKCPNSTNSPHTITFVYDFFLLFEDGLGTTLPTLVSGPDAARFLKQILPANVMQNETSRQTLLNLTRKLLGNIIDHNEPTDFFDFCVEAYRPPGNSEILYKLVNTVLEL
ncbi:telomere-binding alpha subunit central domain protein [Gigaspora margarita]|uniref:Protection of telomeres protein 1 n=1 Tax=Gigaspora margarita TaxID=4874 RepID=A0A8H3WXJ3_GIGMA|nr:telomere-binding alpha subunit central domain protein [Gigaspora margarita]